MNAPAKIEAVTMRTPFPAHHISKLPKETKAQAEARKSNREGVNCTICGGWHHPRAVHLDYVGHAALTDRLLDVDPEWSWEPVAFNSDGLPAFDRIGGLWIKLTVLGVTRLGYGCADGKSGGDAIKEIIGDALRNAAMRFGAALDLWHKGDLHLDDGEATAGGQSEERTASPRQPITSEQVVRLQSLIKATSSNVDAFCKLLGVEKLPDITANRFDEALGLLETKLARMAKSETDAKAKENA